MSEIERQIIATVALDAGSRVVDLLGALCDGDICSGQGGYLFLYRDTEHLSVPASTALIPLKADALTSRS